MKQLTVLSVAMVTVGLATLTAVVAAQNGHADANAKDDVTRSCSERTLRGNYGFTLSGVRPGVAGAPEQFAGVSLKAFDGEGTFTQVDNVHGPSGAQADVQGWGVYTVNPDCSGTMTLWNTALPFPLDMRIVIMDAGAEVRAIVMAPAPIIVASAGRKVF